MPSYITSSSFKGLTSQTTFLQHFLLAASIFLSLSHTQPLYLSPSCNFPPFSKKVCSCTVHYSNYSSLSKVRKKRSFALSGRKSLTTLYQEWSKGILFHNVCHNKKSIRSLGYRSIVLKLHHLYPLYCTL